MPNQKTEQQKCERAITYEECKHAMNVAIEIYTTRRYVCDLCGKTCVGKSNNAQPLEAVVCCDACNSKVIVNRIKRLVEKLDRLEPNLLDEC